MSARADTIVVGLGAMGAATICALAARGESVIGIDRFAPPHDRGSTHGDTRITRLSVGEGPEYVPLVARAHVLWRELEARAEVSLMALCGGLVLGRHGSGFMSDTFALAERFGIAHERLDNAELRRRHPMFAVDDATEAYYEPTAGYLRPEAAVTAQLSLARADGADLRLGERVTSWAATTDGGVRVETDAGAYDAEQLVICAGAWVSELYPPARELVAIHRQTLHWFAIRRGHAELAAMPIFIWDFGGDPASEFVHLSGFYGFPALDGPAGGLKVGTETYASTIAPDDQTPPTADEASAVYRQFVDGRLPWLGPDVVRDAACLYTCVPRTRFLIDRHPEHANVLIVSPCSGHGFKHSPAIGEAVARWVRDGPDATDLDLAPFALSA